MKIYQFSLRFEKLDPNVKYNMLGEKVYNVFPDSNSLIGEVVQYDRKELMVKIQLYEAMKFSELCQHIQDYMFNVKYTGV